MNIRTDFVTNSSSASFMLAIKDPITDKQIRALGEWALRNMIGKRVLHRGSSTEDVAKVCSDYDYYDYDDDDDDDEDEDADGGLTKEVKEALADGMSIYEGLINYEEADNRLAHLYESAWNALWNASGEDEFVPLLTDLSY